jgi:Pectate lyase superfamily protein
MTLNARLCLGIAAWLAVALAGAQSQVPPAITYQGSLTAGAALYSGAGLFKFALVNGAGTATFWSNDGSSVGGSQPVQAITNPVSGGLFTVLLGGTNMQPVSPAVFTNADVRLRIWFSDGTNGFALLAPDQQLTSTGYAMMAAGVANGAVTSNSLAAGAVSTANIAAGAITSTQLALNAVTAPALANGSVIAVKLGPQAVTSSALAQGAVTSAQLGLAAVTTPAIANGAVTAATLAPSAVTGSAIADGTIGQSKLNFQLGYINARNPPFNATGNGTSDDTSAIQSALNSAATNGGGIVFLPQGNYRINSSLAVPAQTSLVGIWRAPAASSQAQGTTLLAVAGAGATNGSPFITLQGNNSTLEGVTIYYPNQVAGNPPIPYPWAIQGGGGENVTIQNVLLVNPYLGIDLATHKSARHLVRGVYGQPLLVGIAVDQCDDIGRIMEIHFWPFWSQNTNLEAFQSTSAVSFDFMRTDWEVVQDIFSWGYYIGARFRASANGAMNGQMSNINFDNVDIGLQLSATQPYAVHISNLNVANAGGGTHHIGIQGLAGNAGLNVNGATFWGSLYQPVNWANSGLLSLSNARFLYWSAGLPCIQITSGRAILQDNYFSDSIGIAISVTPTTQRAIVLGNMLCGNPVNLNAAITTSANNQP